MGLGKTYSADYLIDSNGNTGVSGQVLISTATGIDWADGAAITGGPFLPLSAGSSYPLTNSLYLENTSGSAGASPSLYFKNGSGNFWRYLHESGGNFSIKEGTATRLTFKAGGNVGIGTTNPIKKLDVYLGTDSAVASVAGTISAGEYAGLHFGYSEAGNSNYRHSAIVFERDDASHGDARGKIHILNSASGSASADLGDSRLTILPSGNVGIGTTDPTSRLSIKGTQAAIDITRGNTGDSKWEFSSDSTALYFSEMSTGTRAYMMTIKETSGNVGIGTTSPSSKLHVNYEDAESVLTISRGGTNLSAGTAIGTIQFNADYQGSPISYGSIDMYANSLSGVRSSLDFNVKSTSGGIQTGLTVQGNSGTPRVGIGTTSPGAKLDITTDHTSQIPIRVTHNNYNDWLIQKRRSDDTQKLGIKEVNSNGGMGFATADAVRMVIDSSGNVGIGTTSPSRQLELRGQGVIRLNAISGGDPGLDFNTSDVNDMQIRYRSTTDALAIYSYGTSSDVLTIRKSDGNVGIGTTSPGYKLEVEGAISAGTANSTSGSLILVGKYSNGNIITIGGGYSAGGAVIGYGVKPSTTAAGAFLSSSALTNLERSAYVQHGSTHQWWTGAYQTAAVDSAATLSQVMTLDGSGNLGIGTTSPQSKLHVQGGVGIFNVSDDWHQSSSGTHIFRGSQFNSSINEESTAIKVFPGNSVRTAGDYWGGVGFMHLNPENGSWGSTFTGEHFWIGGRVIDTPGQERSALVFATNNVTTSNSHSSEKMVILPDGNVGIGTTTPTAPLHIEGGTTSEVIKVEADANPYVRFVQNGTNVGFLQFSGGSAYLSNQSAGSLLFRTNNTDKMVITSPGNVGIGTTSPGYKLTVDNDDLNTNNPALYVKNPNSSTAAVIAEFVGDSDSIQIKNIGTGDYAIYNTQQSNGIALYDGTGGVEIHYNGSTVLEADSNGGIKVTGQLSATGDVVAYSSDERLKENIKPIENAVDKIKQLKGVTFDWNEKSQELGFEPSTKTNDVGVIAQDVEAVFPQLVHLAPFDIGSDEEGKATSRTGEDYKTVNYARLTAVLIEAVKEQQKQIDELKEIINGFTK